MIPYLREYASVNHWTDRGHEWTAIIQKEEDARGRVSLSRLERNGMRGGLLHFTSEITPTAAQCLLASCSALLY